jgi:hypothetical protein
LRHCIFSNSKIDYYSLTWQRRKEIREANQFGQINSFLLDKETEGGIVR